MQYRETILTMDYYKKPNGTDPPNFFKGFNVHPNICGVPGHSRAMGQVRRLSGPG